MTSDSNDVSVLMETIVFLFESYDNNESRILTLMNRLNKLIVKNSWFMIVKAVVKLKNNAATFLPLFK